MSGIEARTVRIHGTAFVAPGAVVLGDVVLGPRSSVWFNTVVRGDSAPVVVGEDTNLQDNSVVHEDEGLPALLGARVTVGHRAIIHGCLIEDDCLIGMGSVVLSGARIGAGSLIGAASLVREGQVIPPGSLAFGAPARVMGPVAPAHRDMIRRGASHYVELARTYLHAGLARCADRHGRVAEPHVPMSLGEWARLVEALAQAPERVARRLGDRPASAWPAPAVDRLAAWTETDRRRRGEVLEALLRGDQVALAQTAPAPGPPAAGRDPAATWEEWRDVRHALARKLAPLGPPEWARVAAHPYRGPFTLAELLREWVEEDLEAGRELAVALMAAP